MKLTEKAKGVYAIFTTPFKEDESLDLDGIDRLVEFYRSKGCNGLTLLGVFGEAPKLSTRETKKLISKVVGLAGDMPVIVGIAAPGLAQTQEMAHEAMDLGASGVMVNATHTIRTDADCLNYFKNLAARFGDELPFVLQDFPLSTGVQIPVHIIEQVIREHPNCVMLKQEDWPGWYKIDHLRKASAEGKLRRISILTGFGGLYLPEDLLRGSDGAMIGFSYPEMLVGVVEAKHDSDIDRMYDIFDSYLPLIRCELSLTKGLAVRKYILKKRGVLSSDKIRSPGQELSLKDKEHIDALMLRLNRRLDEISYHPS